MNNLIKNEKTARMALLLSLCLLFTLSFSFNIVSAAPPTQTNRNLDTGLDVSMPGFENIEYNTGFNMTARTFNLSNGLLLSNSNCSVDILSRNGGINYDSPNFSKTPLYQYHFISSTNFTEIGELSFIVYCDNVGIAGFERDVITITSTAEDDFPFYLVILILSAGIIVFGFAIKDGWLTILGSFGLTFVGLYTLRYGIDGIRNLTYSYSISVILIMVAAYIAIRSGLELVNEGV